MYDPKKYDDLEKTKVLFVDDCPDLLLLYETLFQKCDQDVIFRAVQSGDKALDLLRGEHFDLLITDLTHCGGSGIPFLELIRNFWPDLPVIVCSGYSSTTKVEEAFQSGVKDYIIKPFHPSCLIQAIRNVLFESKVGTGYIKQCLAMVCHHISYLLAPNCKSEWGLIGVKKPDSISIEDCSDAVTAAYRITPPPYSASIPETSENFPLERFTPPTLECIQTKNVVTLDFPGIQIVEKSRDQARVLSLSTLFCIPLFIHLPEVQCIHLFPHSPNFPVPVSWSIILKKAEKQLASSLHPIQRINTGA
ncbi:MAG: response regulator [bacterium]